MVKSYRQYCVSNKSRNIPIKVTIKNILSEFNVCFNQIFSKMFENTI